MKKSVTNKNKVMKIIIFIVGVLVMIIGSMAVLKIYIYPNKHFEVIKKEAANNNMDPYLILAIIRTESKFNESALSSKQAKGLMQIVDSTASDMNDKLELAETIDENNIYDIDINIALGCKYFKSLVDRYNGNYYLAICAYNAGMGNVDKWLKQGLVAEDLSNAQDNQIPFGETKRYLQKVISAYQMYRFLYR